MHRVLYSSCRMTDHFTHSASSEFWVRILCYFVVYRQSDISTNRGNFLLIKLLQDRYSFMIINLVKPSINYCSPLYLCTCRYPHIVTEQSLSTLWQWLRAENESDRSKCNEYKFDG